MESFEKQKKEQHTSDNHENREHTDNKENKYPNIQPETGMNKKETDNALDKHTEPKAKKPREHKDDNGKVYRIGDTVMPNCNAEINGYNYKTDEKGRTTRVKGTLKSKTHDGRNNMSAKMESIGKGDQKDTDERGHLIGDQHEGTPDMINLVAMDKGLNRKDYAKLENSLRKAVDEGKDVKVNILVKYEGDSHRPTSIRVTYTIDGEKHYKVFKNEGGVKQ